MNEQEDSLKRAYARLTAVRKNLPNDFNLSAEWVAEYHQALEELAGLGLNLDAFRVPSEKLRRIPVSGNYLTGETTYSKDLFIHREFLMTKIDGVLGYFELVYDEHAPRIAGFAAGTSNALEGNARS